MNGNGAAEPRTDLLLTAKDVADVLSVSTRTVWRWVDQRIIPQPIKLNKLARWRASEIQAHIDNLKASA